MYFLMQIIVISIEISLFLNVQLNILVSAWAG